MIWEQANNFEILKWRPTLSACENQENFHQLFLKWYLQPDKLTEKQGQKASGKY